MSGERWLRLQEIFHSASGLDPDRQAAYLDEACAGDLEMKREVESLLVSSLHSNRLEEEVRRVAFRALEGTSRVGTRLGSYRLIGQLGQGGMAGVYLAQRDDEQFQRRVAVKLAYSAQGPAALARFRGERQILAGLDHPNIARLFDGGATEDGVPYLVLEYVEGEPIDRYCDAREMTIADRLRVFRSVCDAVQYAHQNLVVHRDLKPSNILVTPEGTSKLLDFGIAKLLRPDLLGLSPTPTVGLERPMTPEYASPEQVRGEPISTASDIYSLGVVLYELLTGCLPLHFASESLAGIERIVNEVEPERPSAAVLKPAANGNDRTPEERARARGTTPSRLRKALEGDLDNVVLMALRKAPARRYVSAAQLSDDLGRYLEGRMVIARRDTIRYRVGKLVRRHRWAVGAAAAFLVLLVGWAINRAYLAGALASERDEALRQVETARSVAGFLEDVFRSADPDAEARASVTAREMLDRAVIRLDPGLEHNPEVRAEMLHTLGNIYRDLGVFPRADSLLQRALAIRERTRGERDLATAQSLVDLAELRRDQTRYPEAESLLRRALSVRRELLRPDHADIAETLHDLGLVLRAEGRYGEAEGVLRGALALRQEERPTGTAAAATLGWLAQVLDDEGRSKDAEPYARQSVELLRQQLGRHNETARALGRLGTVLRHEGKFSSAESATREALDMSREILGPVHPEVAFQLDNLANVLRDRGQRKAAEPLYREAIRIYEDRFGEDHLDLATVRSDLAELLVLDGRLDEAEELFRRSLAARRRLGDQNPLVIASRAELARVSAARAGTRGRS